MIINRFKVPEWVRKHDKRTSEFLDHGLGEMNRKLQHLTDKSAKPDVSIVIPAYNEEKNLLKTLSSLADLKTKRSLEILVVNNNSSDGTEGLLMLCHVSSYFEPRQGISYARQHGLEKAKGKVILSADADTIYPPEWVDCMAEPLKDPEVACVYGRYSFIPEAGAGRIFLNLHETCASVIFNLRKNEKESINVMGFNSGFRKADALALGGYNHNLNRPVTGRSEDGWMALTLMKKGRVHCLSKQGARVWTSDRRLAFDGGLLQAFYKRFKKEMVRMKGNLVPKINLH